MKLVDTLRFIINHPLNRHRKTAAIIRWLRWQIGSRLLPGDVAVPFAQSARLLVRRGMTGATGNIYTGLHEFEEMAFALHLLRGNDLFVDVGANVGSYTILAAAVAGAKCISFEPIPETFRDLKQNIHLNEIEHLVDARNIGVGHENGTLRFTSNMDTMNHVAAQDEADSIEVEVMALDCILNEEMPILVKIDVEGFETKVITGAVRVLANNSLDAVIMELNGSGNRYGFDESGIQDKMLDFGFKPYSYSPFDRRLIPLEGMKPLSDNVLFLKNLDHIQQRLATAPQFTVNGVCF